MNLPSEFIQNIEGVFGEAGSQFLANIPALIEQASQRWSLTDVQPVPELSYNFVAFATRTHLHCTALCVLTDGVRKRSAAQVSTALPDGRSAQREVVLKMGVPNREMKSEIAALRLFNGEGACQLIDYDEEKYWMLLERLKPGVMLSTLEDDEEATHIAADVMQKIWRPGFDTPFATAQGYSTSVSNFIKLSDWFDGLKRLRTMFNGGTGPLNEKLVDRVEGLVRDFFIENYKPVLMHGDFHHFNILSSERGWLVIDPKGVIGPACYEVGPLLLNPWDDLLSRKDYRGLTKRRIDILHERLGFERERIHAWGLAHAILSAWWSIEDNGDWHYAANFAEMIADLPQVS